MSRRMKPTINPQILNNGRINSTVIFSSREFILWFQILFILLFIFGNSSHAFQSAALKQLWDVPTGEVKAKTVKSYVMNRIKVEEIYYSSREFKGKPVKIFGYFCYPAKFSGKLPAILLSHGGGGTASRPRAVAWAKRGYAVLAIDLPGKGENRGGSHSSGPYMDVPVLLRTRPDPSYNYLVHAVAATRNGINYLCQRPEVDRARIGMIGLSWGGVLAILTNGQDERLKAAVNVFGAGYIPEGCTWEDWFGAMSTQEISAWYNLIDPRNFLATQHAPILFITGTNDHCYYLPTFQKSFLEVKAEKGLILIPNGKHKFLSSYQTPALAWLDQYLKGKGNSFPTIAIQNPVMKGTEKIVIPVKTSAVKGIKRVSLYISAGGPQQWTIRKWQEIKPHRENGIYYFGLPARSIEPETIFYADVKDKTGRGSSTLVQSLIAIKTAPGKRIFAYSSPIRQTFRHENFHLVGGSGEAVSNLSLAKGAQNYHFIQKGVSY